MPEEAYWESLFDVPLILDCLGISTVSGDVVEFGCGYGTFTLPVARRVGGTVHALDIEADLIEGISTKAGAAGLGNVRAERRDFMLEGAGLPDASVEYAMLFNILHCENPHSLLREARRVLVPGGCLGVIHWRYDSTTPRGPSMEIRPRPEDCGRWAAEVGFRLRTPGCIDLPPFHYGFVFGNPDD